MLSLAQSSYSQPPHASAREGLLPGKQLIQAQGVHRASGLRAEEATLDGGDNLRFPSCDPAQSAGPRKIGQGKRFPSGPMTTCCMEKSLRMKGGIQSPERG